MRDLFGRLPVGYTVVEYAGRRWGATRSTSADGRRQWVYAEELGGPGRVSANLYDDRLKPCEMPGHEVITFLTSLQGPA